MKEAVEENSVGTAQFGEDKIIADIFDRIGLTTKWCVELGALNGTHHSNSRKLITRDDWSAVLIEADDSYYEKLEQVYHTNKQVHTVHEFISFEGNNSLDAVLARTPIPKQFDLLSLDIDGNEYHVWDSLREYQPRLIVIEFNPTIPNSVEFIQPRDMSVFQGSSVRSINELAKQKGYELVAANETNAFYVLRDLFPILHIENNSLDAIRTNHEYETQLYQLYDGTIRIAGYDRLFWLNIPIVVDKLQIVSKRKRRYPARISQSALVRSLKYWARRMPFYSFVQYIRRKLSNI